MPAAPLPALVSSLKTVMTSVKAMDAAIGAETLTLRMSAPAPHPGLIALDIHGSRPFTLSDEGYWQLAYRLDIVLFCIGRKDLIPALYSWEAGQAAHATSAELKRSEEIKFELLCKADAVAGEIAMVRTTRQEDVALKLGALRSFLGGSELPRWVADMVQDEEVPAETLLLASIFSTLQRLRARWRGWRVFKVGFKIRPAPCGDVHFCTIRPCCQFSHLPRNPAFSVSSVQLRASDVSASLKCIPASGYIHSRISRNATTRKKLQPKDLCRPANHFTNKKPRGDAQDVLKTDPSHLCTSCLKALSRAIRAVPVNQEP
jgi:hypothetical protein